MVMGVKRTTTYVRCLYGDMGVATLSSFRVEGVFEMINTFDGKYRWLSNFWPSVVELDNAMYASVEHAYQAAKTLDESWRVKLTKPTLTAAGAKKIGQRVPMREDWEDVKIGVMRDLLVQKFTNLTLRQALIDTKGEELVEGNWWGDTFWGVCKGKGRNELGKLLMEIRDELSR